jgi:hypothetical protein
MKRLLEGIFGRRRGVFEVVTVRTPSGEYLRPRVNVSGNIEVSQAEIEEAQLKNIREYADKMRRLRGSSLAIESVSTFVIKKDYNKKVTEITYPNVIEQNGNQQARTLDAEEIIRRAEDASYLTGEYKN